MSTLLDIDMNKSIDTILNEASEQLQLTIDDLASCKGDCIKWSGIIGSRDYEDKILSQVAKKIRKRLQLYAHIFEEHQDCSAVLIFMSAVAFKFSDKPEKYIDVIRDFLSKISEKTTKELSEKYKFVNSAIEYVKNNEIKKTKVTS